MASTHRFPAGPKRTTFSTRRLRSWSTRSLDAVPYTLCGLATTVSQSRRSGLNRSGQSAPLYSEAWARRRLPEGQPAPDFVLPTFPGGQEVRLSSLRGQAPVVLAFDRDIARLMGRLLLEELRAKLNLVAVDELELGAFDYIDVGEPLPVSGVVPVVVKLLVFRPTSTETLLE